MGFNIAKWRVKDDPQKAEFIGVEISNSLSLSTEGDTQTTKHGTRKLNVKINTTFNVETLIPDAAEIKRISELLLKGTELEFWVAYIDGEVKGKVPHLYFQGVLEDLTLPGEGTNQNDDYKLTITPTVTSTPVWGEDFLSVEETKAIEAVYVSTGAEAGDESLGS